MTSQAEKGQAFRLLHERKDAFIIPNPWDTGTARLLATLGFKALATTSAGYAFSCGQTDFSVGREQMLAHVAEIAAATSLPVSADLENCFGDDPATVAETIRLSAQTGIVGASIEDATTRVEDPIYGFELAVERVQAAVEAARNLPFPFTLTARAENHLHGRSDLADTIKRLQAYQDAGAHVLYAPGVTSKADIATVLSNVDRPINVLVGVQGISLSRDELSAMGARRLSTGSALSRAALGAFLRAAKEMRDQGTFDYVNEAVSYKELSEIFRDKPA